jgi:hypothetical protein
VFQHREFWLSLANKKSKLYRAFNFTKMEMLWNEHMLNGAWDGQIHLTRQMILPLGQVGVTTKSYLQDWAIKVAKQLVNRVLVPALDSRPRHDGPDGGTQGVTRLGSAASVAQAAFDELGVGAFDMSPANTIGAPLVDPSFNAAATQAALGEHLHAHRTDYKMCSGCSRMRKTGGGKWHARQCPVVFLREADAYAPRVARGRAFRIEGRPRKSMSISADDLFFFMQLEEKDEVRRLAAAVPARSRQKRRRGEEGALREDDQDDSASSDGGDNHSDASSDGSDGVDSEDCGGDDDVEMDE